MREYLAQLIMESGTLTAQEIVLHIAASAALSAAIYISYWYTHAGTAYSKKFNVSLVSLTILTATVMTVIGNNIALSLGMVGALSIVRFRTAIKDPMDLVFLFWAISAGIICGAGFAIIAVIASVILTAGILVADRLPVAKSPQILLINSDWFENEDSIMEIVKKYCSLNRVKARNLTKDGLNMAIEVRVKEEKELVKALMKIDHVISASLVAHDGEVTF